MDETAGNQMTSPAAHVTSLVSVSCCTDPMSFTLGNLAGADVMDRHIRFSEARQSTESSDLAIIAGPTGTLSRSGNVNDAAGHPACWWLIRTHPGRTGTQYRCWWAYARSVPCHAGGRE